MASFAWHDRKDNIKVLSISGEIGERDSELRKTISQLPQMHSFIVDLSGVTAAQTSFFELLYEVASSSQVKVVCRSSAIADTCLQFALIPFPTVRSAELSLRGDATVAHLFACLRDVPPLSKDGQVLVNYMAGDDADFDGLEKLLANKPSLVSQIMRIANSAYYYRQQSIETLSLALSTIGMSHLARIFHYNLFTGYLSLFKPQQDFFMMCNECAELSVSIAQELGYDSSEISKIWIGGLLHDLGIMGMAFFFPDKYADSQHFAKTRPSTPAMAELIHFGVGHQTLGQLMAVHWGFPSYLVEIVGNHHKNDFSKKSMVLPILCADAYVCARRGLLAPPWELLLNKLFRLYEARIPWKNPKSEFESVISAKYFPSMNEY
ncbi:MAG: HDOD domain-containing protein [Candidatus Riflebacteria bacterium]|nr:HDOD domain-containing protein [Candidatus Riflebacteria bacterium]